MGNEMKDYLIILLFCFSAGVAQAGFPPMQITAKANAPAQEFYVTKDKGRDTNDCSIFKPCKTIQAGINAANSVSAYFKQTMIHIAPASGGTGSSYNENITFSQQGVNLVCDSNQSNTRACLISGTVTVDLTGTSGGANFVAASNESYMSGFVVTATSTNNDLVFSGSTFQRFIVTNCYFDQNGSVSSTLVSNTGTSGGTPSALISYDTVFSNSNATNPAVSITSGARFWMYGTTGTIANGNTSGPSVSQSGAASSAIFNLVQLTGQYNLTDNTATATFNLSTITSGTNPCIVTPASPNTGYALLAFFGCNSSNTNSITGTGVVVNSPGNVRFGSSGDIISTITQTVLGPGFPQGEILIGAGATTGTNVSLSIKNGHVKVAQTTAPTATVGAAAGTGATCTVSNATDSAGKITVTSGSIGTPTTGTQCTLNFNKAFGVAPICTFSPASAGAASNLILFQVGTSTTTTQPFTFNTAAATTTAYTYTYHCMETQ